MKEKNQKNKSVGDEAYECISFIHHRLQLINPEQLRGNGWRNEGNERVWKWR